MSGTLCPACQKDIGTLSIVRGWPHNLRCPHCKERLEYKGSEHMQTKLFTMLALLVVIFYLLVGKESTAAWVSLSVLAWVILEYIMARGLRKTYTLTRREP